MIANNLTERGEKAASVKVELELGKGFEAVGDDTQMAEIPPGTDSAVRFRVRAGPIPGAPTSALGVGKSSSYTLDMSIRPASPYVTTVSSGYVKKGPADPREGRPVAHSSDVPAVSRDRGVRIIDSSRSSVRNDPLFEEVPVRLHRADQRSFCGGRAERLFGIWSQPRRRQDRLRACDRNARGAPERRRLVWSLAAGAGRGAVYQFHWSL
jgi:hypothetical protein